MNGTTYKRCGCRDAAGKRMGQRCPKLRRGGGWNPNHGAWQYQIDLPPSADGRRRPLRRGTYASQTEAEAVLGTIRDALAVAKGGEPADLTKVGDAATERERRVRNLYNTLLARLDLDVPPEAMTPIVDHLVTKVLAE